MAALDAAREGARRYKELLALPGARGPVIASAVGSLPIGIFGLAILLLAHDATGSFASAGTVVGAFSLSNALGAVAQGRLMDRVGQPRVLRVAAAGHVVALVALVLVAEREPPAWVLAACAVPAGALIPQLPAAMRSLWSTLVDDEERRQTAYALVTIVFEVAVVTAPVLAAALSALISPAAAVLTGAALGGAGGFAFAGTRAARGWRGTGHAAGRLGPLAGAGMRTVLLVLAAFGCAIGIVQVALPAFAAERGAAETGGLLLAALSAGSLVGGLIYGARPWPGSPPRRLVAVMLGLGGAFALLALAQGRPAAAAIALLGGLLLAPTTVVASTLLDTVAPAGTVTEAFTVMVMGIVAGTALGNAAGGAVVEQASYEAAVLAAGAVAALGAAVAAARRRTLT